MKYLTWTNVMNLVMYVALAALVAAAIWKY